MSIKTYSILISEALANELKANGYTAKIVDTGSSLIALVETEKAYTFMSTYCKRKIYLICEIGPTMDYIYNKMIDAANNYVLYTECGQLGSHIGENNRINSIAHNLYTVFSGLN